MTARDEFINDIAETALYGGIGYWAQASKVGEWGNREQCRIVEFDEDTGAPQGGGWNLLRAIRSGLAIAAEPSVSMNPTIRRDIVMSNRANDGGGIDADAADVIVQLGCFGRIVYG